MFISTERTINGRFILFYFHNFSMEKQGDNVVAPSSQSTPSTVSDMSGFKPKEKKERTPKQIAAFERMREKRQEQRRLGQQGVPIPKVATEATPAPSDLDKEEKVNERKSIEQAAAMFMEMRRREKENKKELSWEKQLNEVVTKRMDEFEDRLIKLFDEPIEQYVAKKQRKKVTIQEEPKENKKQQHEVLDEIIHDYYPPAPVAARKAPKKQSPFIGRKAVEAFVGYPDTVETSVRTKPPSPFRQRQQQYVPQQY
jgi:hypothetical protein